MMGKRGIQIPPKQKKEKEDFTKGVSDFTTNPHETSESSFESRNKSSYFPLNPGCLIEILAMVYYNPYIIG